MSPRVLILRAPGTNCDEETKHAFALAGGAVETVHVNRLIEQPSLMDEFQILCIPGGFSYGDDVAAGRILATQLSRHVGEAFARFRDAGKLILGICNGFQVLIKSGFLATSDAGGARATLAWNDSGRFEDRWVDLQVEPSNCPFLAGLTSLYLPVAHAEGKFVVRCPDVLAEMAKDERIVLRYATAEAQAPAASSAAQLPYPQNPNGSQGNVAGICDATGRILGLMPHPERFVHPTQHPCWTRLPQIEQADGLKLFQNAIAYFR